MTIALFMAGTIVLAWVLTAAFRQYAIRQSLMDIPNVRASHTVPTPRGGGAAIVLAMTCALFLVPVVTGVVVLPPAAIGAAFAIACLGFIDDHRHVSPLIRLSVHVLLAILAAQALGSMPQLTVAGLDVAPGVLREVFTILMIVWFVNLTNFMDGIDGIASVQTITVCLGIAVLVFATEDAVAVGPLLLSAAVAGFLLWNWPPARIFMGDVGSGYIGFMVAIFTLVWSAQLPSLVWPFVILSGSFVVDATVTLLLRAVRREALFHAHRSHAYQRLAILWGAHKSVTLLCAAINVAWLLPIAALVAFGHLDGPLGLAIAWAPIAIGVLWVNHTE